MYDLMFYNIDSKCHQRLKMLRSLQLCRQLHHRYTARTQTRLTPTKKIQEAQTFQALQFTKFVSLLQTAGWLIPND